MSYLNTTFLQHKTLPNLWLPRLGCHRAPSDNQWQAWNPRFLCRHLPAATQLFLSFKLFLLTCKPAIRAGSASILQRDTVRKTGATVAFRSLLPFRRHQCRSYLLRTAVPSQQNTFYTASGTLPYSRLAYNSSPRVRMRSRHKTSAIDLCGSFPPPLPNRCTADSLSGASFCMPIERGRPVSLRPPLVFLALSIPDLHSD